MVDVEGDRADQAPEHSAGGLHVRAGRVEQRVLHALDELVHALLVALFLAVLGDLLDGVESVVDVEEEAHRLVLADEALRHLARMLFELLPGLADLEVELHPVGVERGAVRHRDLGLAGVGGERQRVVADHPDGGEAGLRRHRAVEAGRQQQVRLDVVLAAELEGVVGVGQCPDALPVTQRAGGLELEPVLLREVAVELDDLLRLHRAVLVAHHREHAAGVGAIEHLAALVDFTTQHLFPVFADHQPVELHRRCPAFPVQASFLLPDLQRLVRRQLLAEAVPGRRADVSDRGAAGLEIDLVSHVSAPDAWLLRCRSD